MKLGTNNRWGLSSYPTLSGWIQCSTSPTRCLTSSGTRCTRLRLCSSAWCWPDTWGRKAGKGFYTTNADIVVDFHIHPGKYEQWHPWVIEWMRETAPSLEQYLDAMEEPAAMRAMLAEAGVDVGVMLAEISRS